MTTRIRGVGHGEHAASRPGRQNRDRRRVHRRRGHAPATREAVGRRAAGNRDRLRARRGRREVDARRTQVQRRRDADPNLRHHAAVLVRKDMAVQQKRSDDNRVGEIQPELHAARAARGGGRDVDVVHEEFLRLRRAVDGFNQKVNLMDMERVHLRGVILNRPLFDGPALRIEHGRRGRIVRDAVDRVLIAVEDRAGRRDRRGAQRPYREARRDRAAAGRTRNG